MSEKLVHSLKIKKELKEIFLTGVNAVKGNILIKNKIKLIDNNLHVNNDSFRLNAKVYLVGFGKAVLGMAMEMEKLLGNRLTKGIISLPTGSITKSITNSQTLSYHESCENNQANMETIKVTERVMNLAESLMKDDTLIVLISGGGSALLSMPKDSLSLAEKNNFWKKLQNSGADIKEVNVIRRKLSVIKGGGLARLAYPARVISLILSDIVGDPVELIAGGPTCCTFPESSVEEILEKYQIAVDEKMKLILECADEIDNQKNSIHNFVIGNNSTAIEAARNEAVGRGLKTIVLCDDVQGLVADVSRMYVRVTQLFCGYLRKSMTRKQFGDAVESCDYLKNIEIDEVLRVLDECRGSVVLIAGGEPTVKVSGTGKGGRNQELALQFSADLFDETQKCAELDEFDIVFLSAGTDGQDGPTDAAGGFGYAEIGRNEELEKYLINNDSYNFYSRFLQEDLVKTGFTGTNVMDLHIIYILKRNHVY